MKNTFGNALSVKNDFFISSGSRYVAEWKSNICALSCMPWTCKLENDGLIRDYSFFKYEFQNGYK